MSDAFWVSYVLLWILVAGLLGLVLLLYRQFGMSYLAPHAQVSMQGLDVGSRAPAVALEGLDGAERGLTWGGSPNGLRARLMVFALPSCSICVDLAGELQTLPEQWQGVEFAWVDGSAKPRPDRPVDDAPGWTVGTVPDDAAHEQWDVSAVPFAFLVAADGVIVSKRLINSRRDVEDQLAEALPAPRVITVERGAAP